jgi:hypothetical protein
MTVLGCSHAVKAGLLGLPVGETGEQRLYSFWWQQRVDKKLGTLVPHMKGRAGHDSDSRSSSSRAGRTGQGVPGSGWSAGRTGEAHTELMTVGWVWADDGQQFGLKWTDGQQQQQQFDEALDGTD